MDNLLLEAIVAELRPRLLGWPVYRVAGIEGGLVLHFDDPARSRVLVSDFPALPRLHLTRTAVRQAPKGTGLAPSASHHLAGAILTAIDKEAAERTVRFRFAGASGPGKSLVAELLGRSSNILLLDADDRILGFSRGLKVAFRRPAVGSPYEPPPNRHRVDPRELTRDAIESVVERSRRESHPLSDLLLELCPALGPLAAREIEHRATTGEPAFDVLREWLDRVFGSRTGGGMSIAGAAERPRAGEDPVESDQGDFMKRADTALAGYLYCDGDPGAIDLGHGPESGRRLLSPVPLASAAADLTLHTYPSLNEAADAYYGPLAAGMAFRAHRDALITIARREAKRAEEIAVKLAREIEAMQGADRYRLYGEALLAGLSQAERRAEIVLVPDPYSAEGETLSITIDPSATLPANAERYFRRYRKAERGRVVASNRRSEQQTRGRILTALVGRLGEASGEEDLARAQEDLRGSGIAVGLERRRPKVPSAPQPVEAGVRLYRSSEGYEILVGKQAEENDRLTFKIASPEDFWLHASGASGAHVVVRNPRGETRLPVPTLREAAELAAFYSRAKGETRVEVIVTRRKYVRRVRGAPRGTVTVKKHETIVALPKNPFG